MSKHLKRQGKLDRMQRHLKHMRLKAVKMRLKGDGGAMDVWDSGVNMWRSRLDNMVRSIEHLEKQIAKYDRSKLTRDYEITDSGS